MLKYIHCFTMKYIRTYFVLYAYGLISISVISAVSTLHKMCSYNEYEISVVYATIQ